MKTAIWFSRHQPTAGQIADASAMGFEIMAIEPGKTLGAEDLTTREQAERLIGNLFTLAVEHNAAAIFGTPSVPVLAQFAREVLPGDVPFFAAWNISRSVEGGKPTFSHKEWLKVGYLRNEAA